MVKYNLEKSAFERIPGRARAIFGGCLWGGEMVDRGVTCGDGKG
jgi:hypothetical protein